MKGSPLRDLILVILVGLVSLWPLLTLTSRSTSLLSDSEVTSEALPLESWLEVVFSHPPKRVRLMQEETVLLDSGGALQEEADALLELRDGVLQIKVIIEWPEGVEQAYAELTVEPGNLPTVQAGAWGTGMQEELFEFSWPVSE